MRLVIWQSLELLQLLHCFLRKNPTFCRKFGENGDHNMDPWLQAVEQIGLIIYAALDFGLREDEERQLSPQLEKLLDLMTSAGDRAILNFTLGPQG
jgi:hypothetical protein